MEPIDTPRFGRFVYDARYSWYEAAASWCGKPAQLSLDADTAQEAQGTLAAAERLWKDESPWDERARAAIVRDYPGLKNTIWFDADHDAAPYTEQNFLAPIAIDSTGVDRNLGCSLCYGDGGLFFGHSLIALVNSKDGGISVSLGG